MRCGIRLCITFYLNANIPVVSNLLKNFKNEFYLSSYQCQVCHIDFDRIGSYWNKSQKKKDLNIATEIVLPDCIRIGNDFFILIVQNEAGNNKLTKIFPGMNLYQIIYATLSFLGAVILQMGS